MGEHAHRRRTAVVLQQLFARYSFSDGLAPRLRSLARLCAAVVRSVTPTMNMSPVSIEPYRARRGWANIPIIASVWAIF